MICKKLAWVFRKKTLSTVLGPATPSIEITEYTFKCSDLPVQSLSVKFSDGILYLSCFLPFFKYGSDQELIDVSLLSLFYPLFALLLSLFFFLFLAHFYIEELVPIYSTFSFFLVSFPILILILTLILILPFMHKTTCSRK